MSTLDHKWTSGPVTVKSAAEGRVEALFSTFDVRDLGGDVVRPGAIKDGTRVLISQWQHGSWQAGRLPIGDGVIRTTAKEAVLDGSFWLDSPIGAETFRAVRRMAELGLGQWSYSLRNVQSKQIVMPDGRSAKEITSVDVSEVSPVLIAESMGTRTLSAKDAELNRQAQVEFERFVIAEAVRHCADYEREQQAELDRIYRSLVAQGGRR